jgi:hypothetical protein
MKRVRVINWTQRRIKCQTALALLTRIRNALRRSGAKRAANAVARAAKVSTEPVAMPNDSTVSQPTTIDVRLDSTLSRW